MRPPLLGKLGQWSTAVIVRLHPDANKLSLEVAIVTGYFSVPIAYADVGVKVLDETGKIMPVVPVNTNEKTLALVDHEQVGLYEIMVQEDQVIASVELTYQGAKASYRVTEVRDLVDPNHEA